MKVYFYVLWLSIQRGGGCFDMMSHCPSGIFQKQEVCAINMKQTLLWFMMWSEDLRWETVEDRHHEILDQPEEATNCQSYWRAKNICKEKKRGGQSFNLWTFVFRDPSRKRGAKGGVFTISVSLASVRLTCCQVELLLQMNSVCWQEWDQLH